MARALSCDPILHLFDHQLCEHAVAVTGMVMEEEPKFANLISTIPHVSEAIATPSEALAAESDYSLVAGAAAMTGIRSYWVPDVCLYDRSMDCRLGIRKSLGDRYAESWIEISTDCADRLSDPKLRFTAGMDLLAAWIGEGRYLLRLMGRLDLIPRRIGGHPSWMFPDAEVGCGADSEERGIRSAGQSGESADVPIAAPADTAMEVTSVSDSINSVVAPQKSRKKRKSKVYPNLDELHQHPGPFTPPQVAKMLGCTADSVIKLIEAKKLDGKDFRSSRSTRPRYRILKEALEAFLHEPSGKPAPKPAARRKRQPEGVIKFV